MPSFRFEYRNAYTSSLLNNAACNLQPHRDSHHIILVGDQITFVGPSQYFHNIG